MPSRNQLIVFLKAPRLGEVKTRLAAEIGNDRALTIYRAMLTHLFGSLRTLDRVQLRITPDNSVISTWTPPDWIVRDQGNGGLTERLTRAFVEAFAEGTERAVIIGSDCPEVTVSDIDAAWNALKSHDLVLGPAADGGYWLVGMCRPLPEIFTHIPWSTAEVLEKTMAIARQLGCKTHLLRTLNDVDTFADWERFQRIRLNGDLSDSEAAEPR